MLKWFREEVFAALGSAWAPRCEADCTAKEVGMTTAGSIFATDLGTNTQFQSVWLGPSLGWQLLPVAPELYISTPGR